MIRGIYIISKITKRREREINIIIHWLQYFGGAIYVGMMFFSICVLPKGSLQSAGIEKRYRMAEKFGFILLFFTILLNLPLEATADADLSLKKLWDSSVLKDLLTNTQFGMVWTVQVLILLFLIFSSKLKKHRVYKWIYFALATGLLGSKSVTSHAYSAVHKIVAITADFLHLLSASIWIGSITAMCILLPLRKKEEGRLFFQGMTVLFFQWGALAVIILLITGIYESIIYVPGVSGLLNTFYGRVLLGKVILFFFLLMIAFVHFLTGKRGRQRGWSTFFGGELAVGLVVLVLTVILTNT
jgi:copper transport protein